MLEDQTVLNKALKIYEVTQLDKHLSSFKIEETQTTDVSIKDIDVMSGIDFELFLSRMLKNLGYRVEMTSGSGDQGVDIIANKQGKIYAIQAKRYSSGVGNKAVQEVIAGKNYYNADVSWVITNSTFTPSAIALASKTKTILWDGNKLKTMIELAEI